MGGDSTNTAIFDLGGVLFSDGTKRAIDVFSSTYGLNKQEVADQLIGKLGSDWRAGKLTAEQFWSRFKSRWKLDANADELAHIWFDGYELNQGTENIVVALARAGYRTMYLSDNVPERVSYLEKRYHFLDKFQGGVFSFEVGVRKPDLEIYKRALEKSSRPAAECVYIDDVAAFLEPAAALGMKTIHFLSSDQLAEDLSMIGLSF
jgi:epoxide hydrolase-like predicted phosphatase